MSSGQWGLNEGMHSDLSSCSCRVGLQEAGVGAGVEWLRRGIQLSEVREIGRSEGGDGAETGACISGEFELQLHPAGLTEYWCSVYALGCIGYRTSCTVWTLLGICRLRSEECSTKSHWTEAHHRNKYQNKSPHLLVYFISDIMEI